MGFFQVLEVGKPLLTELGFGWFLLDLEERCSGPGAGSETGPDPSRLGLVRLARPRGFEGERERERFSSAGVRRRERAARTETLAMERLRRGQGGDQR